MTEQLRAFYKDHVFSEFNKKENLYCITITKWGAVVIAENPNETEIDKNGNVIVTGMAKVVIPYRKNKVLLPDGGIITPDKKIHKFNNPKVGIDELVEKPQGIVKSMKLY